MFRILAINHIKMSIQEVYPKLKDAYSAQNLNNIALTLINLYKEKQFDILRQIAEMISDTVQIQIGSDGKGFSKFMMLYHPDRGNFYRNEIDKLAANNDLDGLLCHIHILKLGHLEEIAVALESYEDIDYSPVYEWDIEEDGYNIVTDDEEEEKYDEPQPDILNEGYTFYDALKLRIYGNLEIELPAYYLNDLDELELSQSEIADLEGIEHCIYVINLDLSDNAVADISPLWSLTRLEELNLADNKISFIDALSNLMNLRQIDLSNNAIDDISPLFNLGKLEYINLSGTRVQPEQIKLLSDIGVTVVVDNY